MTLNQNFSQVIQLIRNSRDKALRAVNKELIELYWEIGAVIVGKSEAEGWGKSTVESLSEVIRNEFPGIRGFSSQNLWRMRQFYITYPPDSILSAVTREISWTSNILILSKSKSEDERQFYLELCRREQYSSRELERQIDSGVFERGILSKSNLSAVLRDSHPEAIAQLKDNYILDFLALEEPFSEKDLQQGLVAHLKEFLLELGKDYAFIGQEYRIQVGSKDYFIDLLFYHRELQCLIAFDLKITDFKPEYTGKMDFYLEALDRQVKKPHEKASVGIILCKNKEEQIVEFALSRTMSPTMVAEYETKLIRKDVLQRKMKEFYRLANEKIEN